MTTRLVYLICFGVVLIGFISFLALYLFRYLQRARLRREFNVISVNSNN